MMEESTIIWLVIGLVGLSYLILNLYVSSRISKAQYNDESRRSVHRWFIWLLPFLGPLITKPFWTKPKRLQVMTKANRKTKKGGFHESGKGMYGVD